MRAAIYLINLKQRMFHSQFEFRFFPQNLNANVDIATKFSIKLLYITASLKAKNNSLIKATELKAFQFSSEASKGFEKVL